MKLNSREKYCGGFESLAGFVDFATYFLDGDASQTLLDLSIIDQFFSANKSCYQGPRCGPAEFGRVIVHAPSSDAYIIVPRFITMTSDHGSGKCGYIMCASN